MSAPRPRFESRWRPSRAACTRAFVGAVTLLLAACSPTPQHTPAPTATAVQAVMPVRQTFHTQVTAFGQLAADESKALSLSLPQAGQVAAIGVVAGQPVGRGDLLLRLTTNPAARSAYLQAQAALTTARHNLARMQRLREKSLATNGQVDAARQALDDARASFTAQTQLGGAEAVAILRAPADGVVTAVDVRRGQRVTAGASLVAFAPRATRVARLGVSPEAATGIQAGMPVTIEPVYAAPGTPPLHGTVAMVGAAVNPQTRLIDVLATLDAATSTPTGAALSATVDTSNFEAWAVPRDALQSDAHGTYLFQIDHNKAKRVNVKVLAPDGSPVGVEGTLDPHAPVITLGSYEVSVGEAVRVTTSATRRVGGATRR